MALRASGEGRVEPGLRPVMQRQHGIASGHAVADSGDHRDSNGRVHGILHSIAAGAERHRRAAYQFRVEPRDVAGAICGHMDAAPRPWAAVA